MQNRIILLLLFYFLFVFSCQPAPINPTEHSGQSLSRAAQVMSSGYANNGAVNWSIIGCTIDKNGST